MAWIESACTARVTRRPASGPCTRVSASTSWKPNPLRTSSSWKSCHAAVPALDTMPTRRGTGLSR